MQYVRLENTEARGYVLEQINIDIPDLAIYRDEYQD